MGLQAAYANLHTDQERDYFMHRYYDVISSFGGKTSYDADNRPLLVMRSFFFQAEDGIRDHCVTGVQTCALPICRRPSRATLRVLQCSQSILDRLTSGALPFKFEAGRCRPCGECAVWSSTIRG